VWRISRSYQHCGESFVGTSNPKPHWNRIVLVSPWFQRSYERMLQRDPSVGTRTLATPSKRKIAGQSKGYLPRPPVQR